MNDWSLLGKDIELKLECPVCVEKTLWLIQAITSCSVKINCTECHKEYFYRKWEV